MDKLVWGGCGEEGEGRSVLTLMVTEVVTAAGGFGRAWGRFPRPCAPSGPKAGKSSIEKWLRGRREADAVLRLPEAAAAARAGTGALPPRLGNSSVQLVFSWLEAGFGGSLGGALVWGGGSSATPPMAPSGSSSLALEPLKEDSVIKDLHPCLGNGFERLCFWDTWRNNANFNDHIIYLGPWLW